MPNTSEAEAKVHVAHGDVDRTCQTCGQVDDRPCHITIGLARPQEVTLDDGTRVTASVPYDEVHHVECHACDTCGPAGTVPEHAKAV
jgi:hypothetical protein